jgi:hypothetical protein
MTLSKPKEKSSTTATPEYTASFSVSIWVDVPIEADTLEAALTHAREIKLDKILEHAHTDGVMDCSKPKVTGITAMDYRPEEMQ